MTTLRVKPFQGLRPAEDLVAEVACRTGGVGPEEAAALVADNPFSLLHIEHAEVDLEPGTPPFSEAACSKARQTLEAYLGQEILVRESLPIVYVYRLSAGGEVQTGIAITCDLDDVVPGDFVGDEGGRARLIEALDAQTSPVVVTYGDSDEVDELTAEVVKIPPLYDFVAPDGVGHTVWRVPGEALGGFFIRAFANVLTTTVTVVDGGVHAAAAARVRHERRENNPAATGGEAYNRVLCVLFPESRWNASPANGAVPILKPLSGLFIHTLT